jgi:TRAP-type C4-dicarboxylate transport system permease small subunit
MTDMLPPEETRRPGRIARVASTLVMTSLVLCVSLQVTSRYVVHVQVSWTEEAARLLLLLVTAVGAILAISSRSHFRMDLLAGRLPSSARRILEFAVTTLTSLFLLSFCYSGLIYSLDMADARSQLLGIYFGIPYSAVPICAAGMLVALLARFHSEQNRRNP